MAHSNEIYAGFKTGNIYDSIAGWEYLLVNQFTGNVKNLDMGTGFRCYNMKEIAGWIWEKAYFRSNLMLNIH